MSGTANPSDGELIEAFAGKNCEEAFRALVERHARWMYAAAFRQLRDRQLAEDAAPAVFILLFQKAHAMPPNAKISSWLFNALQFTVKNLRRGQRRRHYHELRAATQDAQPAAAPGVAGSDPADQLDGAVAALGSNDRAAILLRFYQNVPFDQIGRALGISEAAARKRTQRAVQALRRKLSTTATPDSIALAVACGLNHAPAGLVHNITAGALAAKAGGAVPASILTATKGSGLFMAAAKTKIIVSIALICILAIPTTVVVVHYVPSLFADSSEPQSSAPATGAAPTPKPAEAHESWQIEDISSDWVSHLPPDVKILPTRFPHSSRTNLAGVSPEDDRFVGIRVLVRDILNIAYGWHPQRMVFVGGEPQERFDFIATLPKGSLEVLQSELKSTLGLVGHRETREMDVLLLKVRNVGAPGLKPATKGENFGSYQNDTDAGIDWSNQSLSRAPELLEGFCKMPVIDETGLSGHFSIDVKWKERGDRDPNHEALKAALLKQLGLKLVPSHQPVEMLIVEKVKN